MIDTFINSVTYPNLRLVISESRDLDLFLRVPNSDDSGNFWDQWARIINVDQYSIDALKIRLYNELRQMVLHEVDENFKIDGVQYKAPHEPGYKRPDWAPQP